jgi:hypothetical protein
MAFSAGFYDPSAQVQEGRSSQQIYMSQPGVTNPLAAALAGLQQSLAGQYQGLLQNPTASPLFQGQLGPLLQSMQPSEERARTSLTDTFRAAGGLRSGAYGNSAVQLEGDILGRREEAAGKLLGQAFPQLMQALQNPLGQVSSLIDALKLSQGQGALTSSGGGGGGFSGGGISDPFGVLSQRPYTGPQQGGGSALDKLFYGGGGGGATTGVNSSPYGGTSTGGAPAASNAGSYDLLSRILGGGSGTTYNPVNGYYESAPSAGLGTFSPPQGGPSYPAPTAEYNPVTGAYQGGYNEGDYSSWAQAPTGWEY